MLVRYMKTYGSGYYHLFTWRPIRTNDSSAAMIKESGQEFASTLAMLSKRKTNAQIPGFEGGVLVRSYGDSEVETLNPRHIVT